MADLKVKWQRSQLSQLRHEKALAEFWQEMNAQVDKFSNELNKQLGVTLDDLLAIPDGEIALAVVQPPQAKLGIVILLDFGASRQTVDKLLARAEKAAADRGALRKVEEINETQVIVHDLDGDDKDAGKDGKKTDTAAKKKIAYFVKGSKLVVGSDVPVLRTVLERWDGKHPETFAQSEAYRYIVERCREKAGQPVLTWYVDPVGLANAAITSFGQGNLQAQLALGFLPTLGLTKFKAIGGIGDLAVGDYETIGRALAYVDQPAGGILKALEFPATEQSPPDWVASSVSIYIGLNWNVDGAYAAVENLVDLFKGPGTVEKLIQGIAEDPNGPKLHLKKDVLDQLTGRIHMLHEEKGTQEAQNERFFVALAVKDAAKTKDVLASLAKMPGFPGKPREVRGQTLYEVAGRGTLGDGTPMTGAVAVIDGHLMATTDVALLETIINGDGKRQSLARSAEYRRLAAHFPEKTSVVTFERQERALRNAYDLLRSGKVEMNGLDFSKLPPFEIIRKYMPATGSYAVPDKRGALFVSFSLRNPKK